jgi:hypothetical protein
LLFFIISDAYFTAPTEDSDSEAPLGTAIQDDGNAILEDTRPDEDINEEIVDDPNVLAEVTLPSRICQLQIICVP